MLTVCIIAYNWKTIEGRVENQFQWRERWEKDELQNQWNKIKGEVINKPLIKINQPCIWGKGSPTHCGSLVRCVRLPLAYWKDVFQSLQSRPCTTIEQLYRCSDAASFSHELGRKLKDKKLTGGPLVCSLLLQKSLFTFNLTEESIFKNPTLRYHLWNKILQEHCKQTF